MEVLEYSYEKDLNYNLKNSKKYYAGPSNYYQKKDGKFIDVTTGDFLDVSKSEISDYADKMYDFFSVNTVTRQKRVIESNFVDGRVNSKYNICSTMNVPVIDEDDYIIPGGKEAINEKNIPNYQYFVVNPSHGENEHGTCGSVAAQILLGYNNYYNDRRIIDVKYLNGKWIGNSGDDIFNSANYLEPYNNMNVCTNPMTLSTLVEGTNDDFYNYVIDKIEPSVHNCTCTTIRIDINDGIATVTTTVDYPNGTQDVTTSTRPAEEGEISRTEREHTHSGSSVNAVVKGIKSI